MREKYKSIDIFDMKSSDYEITEIVSNTYEFKVVIRTVNDKNIEKTISFISEHVPYTYRVIKSKSIHDRPQSVFSIIENSNFINDVSNMTKIHKDIIVKSHHVFSIVSSNVTIFIMCRGDSISFKLNGKLVVYNFSLDYLVNE